MPSTTVPAHRDEHLPAAPRLRPDAVVLPVGPDRVAIGVSPRSLVVLEHVPAGLAAWVEGLDGTRAVEALLLDCPSPSGEARSLLLALSGAGLLLDGSVAQGWGAPADGPAAGRRSGTVPEPLGDAGLGVLAQTRRGALAWGARRTRPMPVALVGSTAWADDLAQALAAAGIEVLGAAAADRTERSALVVVVVEGTAMEADLARCDRASAAGQPTMLIEATGVDAVIGHVHLPDAGPCQRCAVLMEPVVARRWREWLAHQPVGPVRLPQHHCQLLVAAAVDRVAAALDALRGRAGAVELRRRLVIDLRATTIWEQQVPVQPACACLPVPALAG